MSHPTTAYKLGACKAAEDFASWVNTFDHDNPTTAPPKVASVADVAVAHVLEKLGAPRKKKKKKLQPVSLFSSKKRGRASRPPTAGGSRFGALKRKLAKKNPCSRK